MLQSAGTRTSDDRVTPEEEIKDPYVLELGGDFTFVGRQRRLRVGDEWYRIDLLFFHRRLRCLVIIDPRGPHAPKSKDEERPSCRAAYTRHRCFTIARRVVA
jgi:predicted nuclease of restriction endonuclease-like (RecB) superfamily